MYYVLKSYGFDTLIGHHFFDHDTPNFSLDQLSQTQYPIAKVRKINEVKPPLSLLPGHQTGNNINWVLLKDLRNDSRGGIDTVYRIETAGGVMPATCRYQDPYFEVYYVAQCK